MIGNKIHSKIRKAPKSLQEHNLATVTNEHDKKISKEIYTYISR